MLVPSEKHHHNNANNNTDDRYNVIMDKLKDEVLSWISEVNHITINPSIASFVQQHLQQLFKDFHTPTHPPYSLMIKRALMELSEESGSADHHDVRDISEFIKEKYEDLPWAHERILDVHLKKLCLQKELDCVNKRRYKERKLGKRRRRRTSGES